MKPLSELDHYEVLEVARDATLEEVERAYRLVQSTYGAESLATYSVFSEADAEAMRERVEHAWDVLQDPDARAAYDATLHSGVETELDEPAIDIALRFEPEDTPPAEVGGEFEEFEEAPDEDDTPWCGARLRRNRLQRGVDLERIATVTKINPTYLRFIEEDHFEDLPAPVYVRGFVTAYVRCLGLDPGRVLPDYMARLDEARGAEGGARERR